MADLIDNVRACLEVHRDRIVSQAAGDQLALLVASQLVGADAAVLPGSINAIVERPEFGHFFRPTAPAPGTVAAIGAGFAGQTHQFGGVKNRTADGRIDLAGTAHLGHVEPGTPAAQQVAAGVDWNQLSSAERLARLAEGYTNFRQSMAASTGVILTPKK